MKKRACVKQLTVGKQIRDEAIRLKKKCGRHNLSCFTTAREAMSVAIDAIEDAIWGAKREMGGSCKRAVRLNKRARKLLNQAKRNA